MRASPNNERIERILRAAELHDNLAIASLSLRRFVEIYREHAGGEDHPDELAREARRVHARALDGRRRVELLLANLREAAGPHFKSAAFNNVQGDLIQFQEQLPDYEALFGSLIDNDCEECRSIIGPGAYLVDLMNLIESKITEPNQDTIPPGLQLLERRPDLAMLPLDCEHTLDEVPYLQIANQIMANRIGVGLDAGGPQELDPATAAFIHLATCFFPFDLPFNKPLSTIRSYLQHFDTDLASLYELFQVPNTPGSSNPYPVSRETLRLSREAAKLVFESNVHATHLARAYGRGCGYRLLEALLNFDGRSTFIDIPSAASCNFHFDQDFSVTLWAKISLDQTLEVAPSETAPAYTTLLATLQEADLTCSFAIRCLAGGILEASRYDGKNRPSVKSKKSVADGAYHHIVFQRANGQLQLFIDGGGPVDTTTDSTTVSAKSPADLYVGAHLGSTSFFKGSLGGIQLWSLAIDPASLGDQLVPGGAPLPTLPVGAWPLDEGSGDCVRNGLEPSEGTLIDGDVSWDQSLRNTETFMHAVGVSAEQLDELAALFRSLVLAGVLELDGYTSHVVFKNAEKVDFDHADDFTIECWVKPAERQTDRLQTKTVMISKSAVVGKPFPFLVTYDSTLGQVEASRSDGANTPVAKFDTKLDDGQFHHLAFVRLGGDLTLYVDGVAGTPVTDTTTQTTKNAGPMLLGCDTEEQLRFTGSMARLRAWSRGLTPKQVPDLLYRRMTGKEPYLAGCWPLDDGGSAIRDLADDPTPGKLNFRSTFSFDGVTSYVDLGGAADFTFPGSDEFTISAWVYPEGGGTILAKVDENGPSSQYFLGVGSDGTVSFGRTTSGDQTPLASKPGEAPFGAWTHIAGVYDAKHVMTLYCNGEPVGSQASGAQTADIVTPVLVGARKLTADGVTTPSQLFRGRVTEVRIWNGAQPQQTLRTEMFQELPRGAPGLVGYWRLDEGTGDRVKNVGQTATPDGTIIGELDWLAPSSAWSAGGVVNLNLKLLDRLHRFVRLADRLGWTFGDLAWVMTAIGETDPTNLTYDAAPGLARVVKLQSELALAPVPLVGMWQDLKTTDATEAATTASQFDQVFNTPLVFSNPTYVPDKPPYHPRYAENPFYTDEPIPWQPFDQSSSLLDEIRPSRFPTALAIRSRLLAALEIDNDDLDLILGYVFQSEQGKAADADESSITLDPTTSGAQEGDLVRIVAGAGAGQRREIVSVGPDGRTAILDERWIETPDRSSVYKVHQKSIRLGVPHLSKLYRFAAIPRTLELSVQEFLDLLELFELVELVEGDEATGSAKGGAENSGAAAAKRFAELAEFVLALKRANLTVPQALYMTKRILAPDFDPGFSADDFPAFLQTLANASKSWLLKPSALQQTPIGKSDVAPLWEHLLDVGLTNETGVVLKGPETVMTINGATFENTSDGVVIGQFKSGLKDWNKITVELWVKCGHQQNDGVLAAYGVLKQASAFAVSFGQASRGVYGLTVSIAGENPTLWDDVDLGDGLWHHVAVTWAGSSGTLVVYVDGVPTAAQALAKGATLPIKGAQWSFAQVPGATGKPDHKRAFVGTLAAVRVWSTLRTDKEIGSKVYKELPADEPGLLGCWLVEPIVGFQVPDGTRRNSGRLVGNPSFGPMPMFSAKWGGQWNEPNDVRSVFEADSVSEIRTIVDLVCTTIAQHLQLQVGGTLQNLSELFGSSPDMLATVAAIAAANTGTSSPLQLLLNNEELEKELLLLGEIGAVGYFAKALGLTVTELRAMFRHRAWFGLGGKEGSRLEVGRQSLLDVAAFKQLTAQYDDTSNQLIRYLALPSDPGSMKPAQASALQTLTGWDSLEILQLVNHLGLSKTQWNTVPAVMILHGCFGLADTLGLSMGSILQLRDLNEVTMRADWKACCSMQRALLDAITAKYTSAEWETEYAPIRDALNERERDILAGYMLWSLGQRYAELDTLEDLYEFLLVDINMAGVMQTSPVKEALNALQLYVYRCRSNLEVGVTSQIPDAWWEWMSHYRVWQANREVFLYPENYLDPSLRKLATPPYRVLEQALLQSDITDATVTAAYAEYFDALDAVANLSIAGACCSEISNPADGTTDTVLFLVGRTRSDPAIFYYRTATLDAVELTVLAWTPWQKTDFKANAVAMTPVYAFDRWFLFWVEQQSKSPTDPATRKKQTVTTASISYSFQKASGAWMAPQSLLSDQLIFVSGFEATPITNGPAMNPLDPCWNSVVCQHVPARGVDGPEGILVSLGPVLRFAAGMKYVPPVAPKNPTDADQDFVTLLADAVTRATPSTIETQTGWVTVVEPIFLGADLAVAPQPWVLLDAPDQTLCALFPWVCEYGASPSMRELRFTAASATSPFLRKVQRYVTDSAPVPTGYWPIAESSGTRAPNDSGNANVASGVVNGISTTAKPLPTQWLQVEDYPLAPLRWVLDLEMVPEPHVADSGNLTIANTDQSLTAGTNEDFTVEFWFKATDVYHAIQMLLQNLPPESIPPGSQSFSFELYDQSERNGGEAKLSVLRGKNAELVSDGPLSIGEYHHVAFVGQQGMLSLYVDGKLQVGSGQVPDAPGFEKNAYPVVAGIPLGLYALSGLNGVIADLRIWSDSVSPAILSALAPETTTIDVGNRAGWAILNSADGSYLVMPKHTPYGALSAGVEVKTVSYGTATAARTANGLGLVSAEAPASPTRYRLEALTSQATRTFAQGILLQGPAGLLTLPTQYAHERPAGSLTPSPIWVESVPPHVMDFSGAYGAYYWEIFFHIPFLIANTLSANQKFSDAKKWYEYVFNPIQQPVQDDASLTHDWAIDAGSGTEVTDAKGSDSGTVSGIAHWTEDKDFPRGVRQVLSFGADGYVSLAKPALSPGEFTISGWAKLAGAGVAAGGAARVNPLYAQADATGAGVVLLAWNEKGQTQLTVTSTTAAVVALSVTAPQLDEWHHYLASVSSDQVTLYIDGVEAGATPNTLRAGWQTSSPVAQAIGHYAPTTGKSATLNGNVADMRVWNSALDPSEAFAEFDRGDSPTSRFWRFRPFRRCTLESVAHMLSDAQAIRAYEDDPFDPEAIARLRLGAFEKAVVMHYVSNLIDWGDNLFSQFTWEAIVEATMLYVLAGDLLGPEPVQTKLPKQRSTEDWQSLKGLIPIQPGSLARLETVVPVQDSPTLSDQPFTNLMPYFCDPENAQLLAYWPLVADRLYKIRHGENIEGQVEQLALFQPPIDPAALVAAVDSGEGLAAALGALTAPMPFHRFTYLVARAKELAQGVVQLGDALLAALEKGNAEELAVLHEKQTQVTLNLTTAIRQQEVDHLNQTMLSLQANLASARARQQTYQAWINQGLLPEETGSLELMSDVLLTQVTSMEIKTIAIPVYLAPNIFGFSDGGMQFGQSVDAGAGVSDLAGAMLSQQAQLAETMAGHVRRANDWALQLQTATQEVAGLQAQIAALQIRITTAQASYELNQTAVKQAAAVQQFLETKFTNQQMYQWIAARVSTVYFQTYKLALALTQAAERAFQYERSTTQTIVSTRAWDSLHKGLSAGHLLEWDIRQLEEAYRVVDERRLEIEKTISLRQLNPGAFFDLKSDGSCTFSFDEYLFDQDFPGHYDRKIKTIALSIPMVVGPYQNIHATLTQSANCVLLKADPTALNALLTAKTAVPGTISNTAIRANWNASQEIAISKGVNDDGLFELSFHDERYLPFEDTGAISKWTLDMPKAANRIDFESISDVIITLRYTALADRGFRQTVQREIRYFTSNVVFSLKQAFPSEWHALKTSSAAPPSVQIEVPLSFFPGGQASLGNPSTNPPANGVEDPSVRGLKANGAKIPNAVKITKPAGGWEVGDPAKPWTISATKTHLAQLDDIAVIVPFYQTLTWPAS